MRFPASTACHLQIGNDGESLLAFAQYSQVTGCIRSNRSSICQWCCQPPCWSAGVSPVQLSAFPESYHQVRGARRCARLARPDAVLISERGFFQQSLKLEMEVLSCVWPCSPRRASLPGSRLRGFNRYRLMKHRSPRNLGESRQGAKCTIEDCIAKRVPSHGWAESRNLSFQMAKSEFNLQVAIVNKPKSPSLGVGLECLRCQVVGHFPDDPNPYGALR